MILAPIRLHAAIVNEHESEIGTLYAPEHKKLETGILEESINNLMEPASGFEPLTY